MSAIPTPGRRLPLCAQLVAVVLACVSFATAAYAEPSTVIRNNGSSANRVDLLILGDGYTAAEIASGKYASDIETFVQGVFAQEPYSEYRNYYNVTRIDVTSAESGADHPERVPQVFKNTALDATYGCSGIDRLICVNTTKVNTVIANSGIAANARDIVLVIVNDSTYGGSGGSIAVASTNASVVELILHETGHSFGLLADEYGGPPPPSCVLTEPPQANATRQTDRASIKWNAWIDGATPVPTTGTNPNVPGLYEGAVYCDTGAYRPSYNSKMRSLGAGFYQVNIEQHVKRIYNLVSPIDGSSPAGSTISSGSSQAFSVTIPQPYTHVLGVVWRVDGVSQGIGTQFNASGMTNGQHTVTATVTDPTAMVRNDPTGLLDDVRTWTVNVTVLPPSITQQPSARSIPVGGSTTFSAAATGALSWAWQLSTNGGAGWTPLTDVAPYSGTTTPTLSITNAPISLNGNLYRAVATNGDGSTPTNSALLAVSAQLVQNGNFNNGTTGWLSFATPDMSYIVSSVTNGVLQFYRQPPPPGTTNQATVYTETGAAVSAGAALVAQFDLGNSSSVRKRVSVLVLDSNFSDLAVCTFWLPANAPLHTYQMQTHTTQAWANAAIYFYAATAGSNGGSYLLDNVSLQGDSNVSNTRTTCVDPTAPVPPGGADGADLLTNGDFGTGQLTPWGLYGQITSQIVNGVFEFYRPAGTPAGVVLQATTQPMTANQLMTATFALGNSSSVRKRVTVLLHDNDFSDLSACTFYLAPGQSLSGYTMRTFATQAWANATISVYPATVGTQQWIRLDDVTLKRTPSAATTGTECIEPAPPGPPPTP